jgi:hypothetical protein
VLPQDVKNPFDNDYTTQVASQALIEGVDLLASEASERLLLDVARRDSLVGCAPSGPEDDACRRSFIERFGRRALRRPLAAAETDAFVAAARDVAMAESDFWAGIDVVVRALLQHPELLYRVEIGTPVSGQPGVFQLSDWEIATRLSFFLWGTIPDEALLDRAAEGRLATAQGVREAAEAMLADPQARGAVDRFHALWMNYETLPHPAELTQALRTETAALIGKVIFDDRRAWQDLFRSTETYVNDFLAEHYGLPLPGSTTGAWVAYGDSGRRGLFSHGTFLSNGAKFADTSPTLRGLMIRTRLFCQDIPPPPPGVNTDDPIPTEGGNVCKVDRYGVHRVGGCASCHELMDPVGFGLENYDAQGRFRQVERDLPATPEDESQCVIDGQGEIVGVGSFHGPGELADLLMSAGVLTSCVATQLYRFAVGRYELDDLDRAAIERIVQNVGEGDFRLDQMLTGFVASDTFRYRREKK